jgi:hypothetical protein
LPSAGIEAAEFREWIGKISDADMHAVEAFVIGDCGEREALSRMIRERSNAPVLCLNERHSLDDTPGLFAAGVDDVARKPVHVREILARVGQKGQVTVGELRVYFDGREPEANGEPFPLPAESDASWNSCCVAGAGGSARRRSSNAVYGLFDEDVDENVIEILSCGLRIVGARPPRAKAALCAFRQYVAGRRLLTQATAGATFRAAGARVAPAETKQFRSGR